MGGNIGLPILAQDPLPEGGVYVLELSSYQIDLTQSLDCDVAVLLNITPGPSRPVRELRGVRGFEGAVVRDAGRPSTAIIMIDDDASLNVAASVSARSRTAAEAKCADYLRRKTQSAGQIRQTAHSWARTCKASQCPECGRCHWQFAASSGSEEPDSEDGLRTYPGLPHRMERVREKDGVLFVNDSKATNPTATAPALAAFPSIRWILGGQAKTDNLDECAPHFGHVRSAYTIGEAGELFARLLAPHMPVDELRNA